MSTTKEEAINLITRLPDEASWDDIMYEMYVKKKIELGIKAARRRPRRPPRRGKEDLLSGMKLFWTEPAVQDLRDIAILFFTRPAFH